MPPSSFSNPGQSDRKYREYYYLAHGLDALPSADKVEKDLADARAALEASNQPGDSWLKEFADGIVPSADEVQELDAALQAFGPVLRITEKQANIQHVSRIEMLEGQLREKQQRISDLESEASEAAEMASRQAIFDELRREKYDKQTPELQEAQASIARLQQEKDAVIQELTSKSEVEAKAKAESDEKEFRSRLTTQLKEQADAMAREAEKMKAAHKSELEQIASQRKLDAKTWEENRLSELKRIASERESEAETRKERRESEQGDFHKQFTELQTRSAAQDEKIEELQAIIDSLPTEEQSQIGLKRAETARRLSAKLAMDTKAIRDLCLSLRENGLPYKPILMRHFYPNGRPG
jgi:DNA repair exonuclease SbcCD ATPase subunit